jgi:hypothetical protein
MRAYFNLKKTTYGVVTIATLGFTVMPATAKNKVRVGFGTTWPTFSILQLAEEQKLLGEVEIEITVIDSPVRGYQTMLAGRLDVALAISKKKI